MTLCLADVGTAYAQNTPYTLRQAEVLVPMKRPDGPVTRGWAISPTCGSPRPMSTIRGAWWPDTTRIYR